MTLEELTKQESGIVLWGVNGFGVSQTGADMIICNWTPFEGVPRLFSNALVCLDRGSDITTITVLDLEDIGHYLNMDDGVLPGNIELIYDANNDIADLPGTPGTLYEIEYEGERLTVVAPRDWA
jgi:hypothetical protein